ncbi:Protein couch potato [Eumeta japonica]|uniref:Protein couch potato n=1 Tax=Eumeta variegata TaxID=151549 RepID=A0A4C1WZD6_EUMVA|nr:Protein couch potato [Eumeta japonica]
MMYLILSVQGYEGSLLKVTSKNGKTASPVGFVTFHTRAGAEAAKQDLQVCTGRVLTRRTTTMSLTRRNALAAHVPDSQRRRRSAVGTWAGQSVTLSASTRRPGPGERTGRRRTEHPPSRHSHTIPSERSRTHLA